MSRGVEESCGVTEAAGIRAASERTMVEPGQPLQFYCRADGIDPETITEYLWDFGDGAMSREQNAGHVYGEEGAYCITLKVTLSDGRAFNDTIGVGVQKECLC